MSIERHPTNGGYRVKFYPNGRNAPCKRINYATYEEAEAFDTEWKSQQGVTQAPASSTPRFNQVYEEYLKWVKLNQSPITHKFKESRFEKHIIPLLGALKPKDLRQSHLDAYAAKVGYWVYNNDVMMLKALITWMVKRNYAKKLEWSPEKHQGKHKVKFVPHPADLMKIIENIPQEKHRIFFSLLLYTGLRYNEAVNLLWQHVDMNSRTIQVKEIEHGDEDIVYIPEPLESWFEAHKKPSGYVFEGRFKGKPMTKLSHVLKKAGAELGIVLTPHSFRHASGTYLYEKEHDLYAVQMHLRHRSIKTSTIYARMSIGRRKSAVSSIVDFTSTMPD